MGWGHWRAPEVTEEMGFRLRVQGLELEAMLKRDPQELLFQAQLLDREKAILERILDKASRHIAELEAAAALRPPVPAPQDRFVGFRPWWF